MHTKGFALLWLILIIGIISGIAYFAIRPHYNQNNEGSIKQILNNTQNNTQSQQKDNTLPKDLLLYKNETYDYQLKYPPGWHVYAVDNNVPNSNCTNNASDKSIVVFSEVDLYSCGFYADQLPNPDSMLTVYVDDNHNNPDLVFENTLKSEVDLNGVKAYRHDFNEDSPRPNLFPSSRIYVNYNDRSYIIFSGILDTKEKMEIFDLILSTLRFNSGQGFEPIDSQCPEGEELQDCKSGKCCCPIKAICD